MTKISSLLSNSKANALKAICIVALFFLMSSCSVMLPVSATGNAVGGKKTGRAKATSVFGFWVTPDASIPTAAANGGITHISTVDVITTNYLWIVRTYETVVVGD